MGHPIPEIRLFQTMTLKLQGQSHGCGQRSRWYSHPSILMICFIFILNQSDYKFLRYSYFEIWLWNIQGQGHEWGQRSRSHIVPSYQPMDFLFVSHQLDQPFLRCGKDSVWPWKNTSEIFKGICQNYFPKSTQVINMTKAMKLLRFVVIGWLVLILSCRQVNYC